MLCGSTWKGAKLRIGEEKQSCEGAMLADWIVEFYMST